MSRDISPTELFQLIGTPDAPQVIDVRRKAVFETALTRIPGAQWREPLDAAVMPGRSAVVYCAHGHNVSEMAAARCRQAGSEVRVLEGGIAAWEDAGLPTVSTAIPGVERGLAAPSRWITRERPKVDRIACPWLIRRFVDPDASFQFVKAAHVADIAAETGATPFDIDGVFYSHRGAQCSFDAMLAEFGLHDPALDALALIVRGADTADFGLAPEAAGLLAVSLGLSAGEADDHRQLEKGFAVYDALYAWARHAKGETHNWPPAAAQ